MQKQSPSTTIADGNTAGLLTTKEAAALLGLTVRFLEARRVRGGGPRFVAISSRMVRYRLEDLQAWVTERLMSKAATSAE